MAKAVSLERGDIFFLKREAEQQDFSRADILRDLGRSRARHPAITRPRKGGSHAGT